MNETEADTRLNRIDPVLRDAGWVEGSRIRRRDLPMLNRNFCVRAPKSDPQSAESQG